MNINVTSPAEMTSADQTSEPGRPARILVVDDVEDNRDIFVRRLGRRGFEMLEAENGTEALDIVEREHVDLILLDIMMPDIDGTEVVRRIRRTLSADQLPIIMVSAKTLSEDVAQSLDLGANDYIIKPVDFTVALARIHSQLDRKRIADGQALETAKDREELQRTSALLESEASARKRSQDQLQYLAYHDELTGLMNRVAFREKMTSAMEDPRRVERGYHALFIDLDRFKAINDVYGHTVGDNLLRQVGARLTATLKDAVAVARLGGDEFAALIAEDGVANRALERAQQVVETLSEPFENDDESRWHISASVGVANSELCDFRTDTLMKAADLAMYNAKAAGRGRTVVFEQRLLDEQRERSLLEVDLRRALDREEFTVYYQPLIDASTKKINGFEALVRWHHPEKGLISPGMFVPAAEESGLINRLGAWVLRRACADAAAWVEPVPVSVNLSPEQFRDPDLVSAMKVALERSGLPAERLEVEITEGCLLEAGEKNVEILGRIRELGVRVAIDDFGTGYSSMAYLQNFVFDKLKIDRRFISDLNSNANTSAIISAIVQLGTSIGIKTTAEGIETEDQLEAVIAHGCSELQGFLLSVPLSLEDTVKYMDAARQG
ncbi:putative bifunctional diguanylate cyclase/phosphodiesterase [Roseitranquillus sediminis]|uniref:putative bifunctional diguanylate cyclase/phosphodiesterase n=1 Tax=Roseitranquillus sediminis TaxID=2809051 RepID=UPI001D0C923F|nr:EAL domain-containing protein [Roseitranquillus sediminis]MBM9594574.1 EAL domain-containing protein [Roseitranquillus sediminis]